MRHINILVNRTKTLPLVESNDNSNLVQVTELANMGYEVKNPEKLKGFKIANFNEVRNELLKLKGGDVDYVPMFANFPKETPDNFRLFQVLTYFFELPTEYDFLNVDVFGYQNEPYSYNTIMRYKGDATSTVFTKIGITTDVEGTLKSYLFGKLYSNSSIQEVERDDVLFLLEQYIKEVDISKIVFKETKTLLMKYLFDRGDMVSVMGLVNNPTDFLRFLAELTESDVSLSQKITFPKMKRSMRRAFMNRLDFLAKTNKENVLDSFHKYKGLWKTLFRYIHPFSYNCVNAHSCITQLMNDAIKTYNSEYMSLIESFKKGIEKSQTDLLNHLIKKPTFAIRELSHLDKLGFNVDMLIETLSSKNLLENVPAKVLFLALKYMETKDMTENSIIINKNGVMILK